MSLGPPSLDPVLARDYPRALRNSYRNVLRRDSRAERHQQLLRLGEASVAYLASLTFADYRRTFASDPDPHVEEFLGSRTRFTMGQYLRLFRLTQRALGHPELFGLKSYEVNVQLEHAQRWVTAVRAIEYAQKVGASDIQRVVEEGLEQGTKCVRWLTFWDELVAYRNQVAHADANGWPLDATGYFEVMTPTLEAALVDALRTDYISHVLLEYPTAQLLDVRRSREGWVQRFDGEYHGVPLLEEVVRESPPEPWESDVACTYILHKRKAGWLPHSRFYDLGHGVPEALSPRAAGRAAATPAAPQPTTAPDTTTVSRGDSASHRAADLPHSGEQANPLTTDSRAALDDGPGVIRAGREPPNTVSEAREQASRYHSSHPPASDIALSSDEVAKARPDDSRAGAASPAWVPSFSPWMLWGILSFGLLSGVGFLVIASRVRDVKLRNAAIAYGAAAVTVLVLAGIVGDSDAYPVLNAIAIILLFGTWFVSTIHAFAVNPRVRRQRARAQP